MLIVQGGDTQAAEPNAETGKAGSARKPAAVETPQAPAPPALQEPAVPAVEPLLAYLLTHPRTSATDREELQRLVDFFLAPEYK